jgi:hypothetical protein
MSFVEGLVLIVLIICLASVIMALIQKRYFYQGQIVVETDENGIHYFLELDGDPYEIQHRKSISFKVVKKDDYNAD